MTPTTQREEIFGASLNAFDRRSLTCPTEVHRQSISCHIRHSMYQSSFVWGLGFVLLQLTEGSRPHCVGGFVPMLL